jgi:hypothetical protein
MSNELRVAVKERYLKISLFEICKTAYGGKAVPKIAKFVNSLSTKRVDNKTHECGNYKYNFHLWRAWVKAGANPFATARLSETFSLVEKYCGDDARSYLDNLRQADEWDSRYVIASVFADEKGEDGIITSTCICAIVGEWTRLALIICCIAVTDEQFTAKKFGKGSDGGSFWQRGFGRFLVGLLQSLYNELHKGVSM